MFYFHIHINISNQLQNYEEYTENFGGKKNSLFT